MKKVEVCLLIFVILLINISVISSQKYTLKVTEEHPFLINNNWIPAKELKVGDELITVDGKTARIKSIQEVSLENPVEVYNLEAGVYHDFVVNGEVVVHNSNNNYYYLTEYLSQEPTLARTCNNDPYYVVSDITDVCFLAGTKISMADGSLKNIEEIKKGDWIISYDGKTNKNVVSKVSQIFRHEKDNSKGYLIINNKLKVTSNHPILINNEWKEIGYATKGDKLKLIDGKEEIIKNIEIINEKTETFNLEVENTHNYYAENILVHNKGQTNFPERIREDLGKFMGINREGVPEYVNENSLRLYELVKKIQEEILPLVDEGTSFESAFKEMYDFAEFKAEDIWSIRQAEVSEKNEIQFEVEVKIPTIEDHPKQKPVARIRFKADADAKDFSKVITEREIRFVEVPPKWEITADIEAHIRETLSKSYGSFQEYMEVAKNAEREGLAGTSGNPQYMKDPNGNPVVLETASVDGKMIKKIFTPIHIYDDCGNLRIFIFNDIELRSKPAYKGENHLQGGFLIKHKSYTEPTIIRAEDINGNIMEVTLPGDGTGFPQGNYKDTGKLFYRNGIKDVEEKILQFFIALVKENDPLKFKDIYVEISSDRRMLDGRIIKNEKQKMYFPVTPVGEGKMKNGKKFQIFYIQFYHAKYVRE